MGWDASSRASTPTEKVKVKVKSASAIFLKGSRYTTAMMRGVNCALASCTATSTAEQTRAISVNMDEATMLMTSRAVSRLTSVVQSKEFSILKRSLTDTSPAGMLKAGKSHIELRTKSRMR